MGLFVCCIKSLISPWPANSMSTCLSVFMIPFRQICHSLDVGFELSHESYGVSSSDAQARH